MEPTYVTGKPKLSLRFEGFVLPIATIILFSGQGQKWWLYPVLLLVPDIFMLGYLANTRLGAFFYNLGHSYFAPAVMILSAWRADSKIASFPFSFFSVIFKHVRDNKAPFSPHGMG